MGLLGVEPAVLVTAAATVATLVESVLTAHLPAFRDRPGWVRNLLTTGAGAVLAALATWRTWA